MTDRDFVNFLGCSVSVPKNMVLKPIRGFDPSMIKDVRIFDEVKNGKTIQAVKMFFTDGTTTVSTPQNGDTFDPEMGMIMCILQYIWEGKRYNNTFRKWIKKNEKAKKEAEKVEERKREARGEQEKREKNAARRKAAKREEAIEIQKEAYMRAMKEVAASE